MNIKEEIIQNLIKRFEGLVDRCKNFQDIILKNENNIFISDTSIYGSGGVYYIYYKDTELFNLDRIIYFRLKQLATDKRFELLLKEIKE